MIDILLNAKCKKIVLSFVCKLLPKVEIRCSKLGDFCFKKKKNK